MRITDTQNKRKKKKEVQKSTSVSRGWGNVFLTLQYLPQNPYLEKAEACLRLRRCTYRKADSLPFGCLFLEDWLPFEASPFPQDTLTITHPVTPSARIAHAVAKLHSPHLASGGGFPSQTTSSLVYVRGPGI
jgi:hypothetical protein